MKSEESAGQHIFCGLQKDRNDEAIGMRRTIQKRIGRNDGKRCAAAEGVFNGEGILGRLECFRFESDAADGRCFTVTPCLPGEAEWSNKNIKISICCKYSSLYNKYKYECV